METNHEFIEFFYLDKDNKEVPFQVYTRKPSMKARIEYLTIGEQHTEDLILIDKKYPELLELKDVSVQNLTPEQFIQFRKKQKDIVELNDKYSIKYFKGAILSTKGLQQHLFNWTQEEPNSDFWMMQDISKIEEAIIFFRTVNKL